MQDERLRARLASIDLTVTEAFSLFRLLDWENRHMLTVDDSVTGCPKLRGQVRTVDVAGGSAKIRESTTGKHVEIMNAAMALASGFTSSNVLLNSIRKCA